MLYDEDYKYNGFVENVSKEFERQLSAMSAVYNFDYGDEYEIAVCKVLRKLLPNKFGICRGFIINKDGDYTGDDIIIYDREHYPPLRFLDREDDYEQKNQIPVEAVYAYIEAKYTLDYQTFTKAFDQIVRVKKVCYTRETRAVVYVNDGDKIFDNEYSKANGWKPVITSPMYAIILSKNCVGLNGEKTQSGEEAQNFILEQLNCLGPKIRESGFFSPDAVVAGNKVTAFCGHHLFGENGVLKDGIQITKFYTGVEPYACYQVNSVDDIAYGLEFVHLMMALESIQLPAIPWEMIFNTAKMPDKTIRAEFLSQL